MMSAMGSSTLWGKIAVLIAVCGWCLSAQAKYDGGSGEPNNPYQIGSVADWQELMAAPSDWASHFVLTGDLDLDGVLLSPVGNDANKFTGVFDGNDYVMRNMDINMPDGRYVGLFGYLGTGGQIKNLGVEDVSVSGVHDVGGLVGGVSNGTINNCYSKSVAVTGGGSHVGGLVGWNLWGSISDCYSTGSVSGFAQVGGLTGYNAEGTINKCYSTGSVSGVFLVGGLTGTNERGGLGAISNCYSGASVTGTGGQVGGLVGYNTSIITNCYSTGSVTGTGGTVGGLVGWNTGTVSMSFWDVNTSGWPTSQGGEGKTTAQMQDINTFLGAGWDFVGEIGNGIYDFWLMPESGGYPILSTSNPYIPAEPGGRGIEADPYIVTNANELAGVWYRPSGYYVMANDIDLAGIGWRGAVVSDFSGVFDGDGHVIRNADINMPGGGYVGLFGYLVGTGGQIRNLGVEDISIFYELAADVGALVGRQEGSVTNCYSTGSVTGIDVGFVGGLIGSSYGPIRNCYSTASVSGSGRSVHVGGLVGSGYIYKCYSTGSVTGAGGTVGGLVGLGSAMYSFWDVDTSGCTTSSGGTPMTTAEMKTRSTFTSASWDFIGETANGTEDIWTICEGTNYPRFVYRIPQGDIVCPDGVNALDFSLLADYWLEADCAALNDCDGADIDLSGRVDFGDFGALAESWLRDVE